MAKQMIDISLGTNYDLDLTDGDFISKEGTAQHQQMLILCNKGDFKQNPTICVGAFNYLDDEHFNALIRTISLEFARDGMEVKNIQLTSSGLIKSDAYYS